MQQGLWCLSQEIGGVSRMQEFPRTSDGLFYFHAIGSYSPFGCPLTCSQQLFLHVDELDGPSTFAGTSYPSPNWILEEERSIGSDLRASSLRTGV